MLDLSDVPVVDVHCHPWRRSDLLALGPSGFEDRTTMLGMCQLTSGQGAEAAARVAEMTETTPFALALRRRLAAVLGCDADRDAVAASRRAALAGDDGYLEGLFSAARLAAIFCDEGYPQPAVELAPLADAIGVPALRVGRIEPWIDELAARSESFAELEEAFRARLEVEAAGDLVAFKSVIAYRTGLDVGDPSGREAETGFARWAAAAAATRREREKAVRDRLLRATLDLAHRFDRPVHIHCGGGDPEIELRHARPSDLFPLLAEHSSQPIVLIHSGWPWIEEAAYIASVLPHVYLDVSVMLPWASLAVDQKLEVLLGSAPTGKVMCGSDEASEPEVIWFSALIGREATERVLSRAIDADWMTPGEARGIARGFLAANAVRLHGVADRVAGVSL